MLTLSIDMNSGPIVAMVWEGLDAVKTGRGMDPPLLPQPP
jgi:nucleoside diphosphate kinase